MSNKRPLVIYNGEIGEIKDGDKIPSSLLPSSPGLFVQANNPNMTGPGIWVQTGLGPSGTDFTIWVEDGE